MTGLRSHTEALFPDLVDPPVGRGAAPIFLAIALSLLWFGLWSGLGFFMLLALLGVSAGVLILRRPLWWVIASILLYIPVFWSWTAEFTIYEMVHAVVFYGGILWWFFQRAVILRAPIRWSAGGLAYALFMLYLILLIPVSILYQAESFPLTRELFVMASVLFFVPLAHEIRTARDGRLVATVFMALPIIYSIRNFLQYKERILAAAQFWELEASRATDSYFLLFFLAILAVTFLVSVDKRWQRIFWLGVLVLGAGAVILTFYRAVWLSVIACYLFMGFLLGRRYWKILVGYGGVALLLAFLGFQLFFGQSISLTAIGTSISERFVSSKRLGRDPSLRYRIDEAEATLRQAGYNVILGSGISTTSRFLNFMTGRTVRARWNHNAFPWMLYHFGLVGSALLLISYFAYLRLGWRLFRRAREHPRLAPADRARLRTLIAGALAMLGGLLLQFWTGNPYLDRQSFLGLSIVYAFFEILDRELPAERTAGNPLPAP